MPLHNAVHADHVAFGMLLLAAGADANLDVLLPAMASTGSRVLLHGLLAVGVRGPVQCVHANPEITAVRIAWRTDDELAGARRAIARTQRRALQVCLGLHARGLDALQLCEILMYACGRMAPLISFHQWCAIATTVKHFAFARSVAPVHL